MNIFDNPFYMLGVSAKSNRQQISSIAEEKIFLNENESKSLNEARNILIIPEKRLAAEIRWFPGVSDKNIGEIIDYFAKLKADQPRNKINMSVLRSAALLNFAVYIFRFHNFVNVSQIAKSITAIDQCFKAVSLESLCTVINRDRLEAGFTMAKRPEVEREFNNYRLDIVKTLNETLSTLSKEEYTKLVEELTEIYAGDTDLLIISDLLDDYELNIMPELERRKNEIITIAANLEKYPSEKNFDDLSSKLEKWQELSKPLISASKSRGIDFSDTYKQAEEIFYTVRDNAINLHNRFDKTDDALKLMRVIKKYFAGISDRFAKKINRDIDDLQELIRLKIEIEQEEDKRREEWAKSIEYETEFGLIFKDKLQISIDGITWKGIFTPLDSITGISWGWGQVYKSYASPYYTIAFQTQKKIMKIEFGSNVKKFSVIIERFWRALAEVLITKILKQLKNGEILSIGNIKFNDYGVFLKKKKLLPLLTSEERFFHWDEKMLYISNHRHIKYFVIMNIMYNYLAIHADNDYGKYFAEASYMNDMNTHILEFIVSKFLEARKTNPRMSKLSDLLDAKN